MYVICVKLKPKFTICVKRKPKLRRICTFTFNILIILQPTRIFWSVNLESKLLLPYEEFYIFYKQVLGIVSMNAIQRWCDRSPYERLMPDPVLRSSLVPQYKTISPIHNLLFHESKFYQFKVILQTLYKVAHLLLTHLTMPWIICVLQLKYVWYINLFYLFSRSGHLLCKTTIL